MKIITEHIYPPIPDRRWDWQAIYENYDGAEDSNCPMGFGRTEEEAIKDLQSQIED